MNTSNLLQPNSENTRPARLDVPAALMVAGGIILILGAPTIIWVFREALAQKSPRDLLSLPYGMGGLALLYLTAGLPLGATLLAAGGARLFSAEGARRVLIPLFVTLVVFFTFHAVRLLLDLSIPFLLFGITGFLFIAMFMVLVWVWARKRPSLDLQRQRVLDFQLGAGLCFFSAAWQSCGLAGAPGFALYPRIVEELGNQSFVAGQAFAVEFFILLAFVFLLLSMRAEKAQASQVTPKRSDANGSDPDRSA